MHISDYQMYMNLKIKRTFWCSPFLDTLATSLAFLEANVRIKLNITKLANKLKNNLDRPAAASFLLLAFLAAAGLAEALEG